jgi:hypothetical protein
VVLTTELDTLLALGAAETGARTALQVILQRTPEGHGLRLAARETHDAVVAAVVEAARALVDRADG